MRRIWTLVSSAVVFLAMAAIVVFAPMDFVVWSPGQATNILGEENGERLLQIPQAPNYREDDEILFTTRDQTDQAAVITLGTVINNYWLPSHSVMPRTAVFSPGQTPVEANETRRIDTEASLQEAFAAGVRAAGIEVIERPKIVSVRQNGPAYGILQPGDLILAIDNNPMSTANDVREYIRSKQVGDQVVVTILRGGQELILTIDKLAGSSYDGTIPTMGTVPGTGYSYDLDIRLNLSIDRGDPAQGLAIALAIYDMLTETNITGGETIAATGRISADGEVSAVSGFNEHAMSAWNAFAAILIIPTANCSDIADVFGGMIIVPVDTLDQAVTALRDYAATGEPLPKCAG
ncbi:MAG: PDZ domain-containing protein [Propionibacteriaceae bacterium]|nr:PDZ domain-containing protein [Propionibacteriaceae bacterium]